MSEQIEKAQNANGRRFRLYEIIIAALLAAFFALSIASGQRTANRISALERKVDENSRQIAEVRVVLAEMQSTLNLIASGLNIRVEPKEQAGPAAAPTPNEKLATRDP